MLLEHFSDIEMQEVTEEILDEKPEELLESMPLDVVQEVLLKADPEQRNDKIVEILNFLEYKKFVQLKPLLSELKPMDIAEIFAEIDEEKLPLIFRLLPKELAAETFVEMNSTQQELLIRSFSDHELKLILEDLFVDDTVDLIEEMPANVVKRILMQADSETRKSINEILKYPKDSAGSIMTTECISLRQDMTVQQCFEKIRRAGDRQGDHLYLLRDRQSEKTFGHRDGERSAPAFVQRARGRFHAGQFRVRGYPDRQGRRCEHAFQIRPFVHSRRRIRKTCS